MNGTCYSFEVRPKIPERLSRLNDLADDLFYSWSTKVRALFYYLHPELWVECGHSPKLFLRRVSQARLEKASRDRTYMESYHLALADYDNYLNEPPHSGFEQYLDPQSDMIAYFSMEFGFHESVPIYSGGLGILAGDHCKAASDLALPLVAVGLLYRQGYFTQTIEQYGNQEAHYSDTDFTHLPISQARDANGNEVLVVINEVNDPIQLRVWEAKVGRIRLYLLDSDVAGNSPFNRTITHQLYGGDASTRILQEMVLGIGGVRALRALGLNPNIWHINEGHGAFQVIERCNELVRQGLLFNPALEYTANCTIFTTHTPVAAGHDIFPPNLVTRYFGNMIANLGITEDYFLSLGANTVDPNGFNMTALALRGSRLHNGVSRIHGQVSSEMESYIWPQISPDENPISYVTNGVHVDSFLAPEWKNLFDMEFGHEWRNQLTNTEYWHCIDSIPDYSYWSIRQTLKSQLLRDVSKRVKLQMERVGYSQVDIENAIRNLSPANTNTLVIGFARRFATYKRATLIFHDLPRLAKIVNNEQCPVMFVFAGKAHPSDIPGQQLISRIHELSQRPEFHGKLILLEGYNMAMARRLVTGVDIWLNTPEFPLEASGTSGQKAGMNGVINLSVLDGWWGEGFDHANGWAITPHPGQAPAERDKIEATTLLDVLEHQIVPTYFNRDGVGYSASWIKISKASMKTILPQYNSQRMVMDYVRDYYAPAGRQGAGLKKMQYQPAIDLALWKQKIHAEWFRVQIRRIDVPVSEIETGDTMSVTVAVQLGNLLPTDVVVECLIGRASAKRELHVEETLFLQAGDMTVEGETLFRLDLKPSLAGLQYYKLRVYPYHSLLTHRYEMGYMVWL